MKMAVTITSETKLKKCNMFKLEEALDSVYFGILRKKKEDILTLVCRTPVPISIYSHLRGGGGGGNIVKLQWHLHKTQHYALSDDTILIFEKRNLLVTIKKKKGRVNSLAICSEGLLRLFSCKETKTEEQQKSHLLI